MQEVITTYGPIVAIAWPLVGVVGSVLEGLGAHFKKPWLEKLGQRLEGASTDLPKLWRASRTQVSK
jgi:hypothetical protein